MKVSGHYTCPIFIKVAVAVLIKSFRTRQELVNSNSSWPSFNKGLAQRGDSLRSCLVRSLLLSMVSLHCWWTNIRRLLICVKVHTLWPAHSIYSRTPELGKSWGFTCCYLDPTICAVDSTAGVDPTHANARSRIGLASSLDEVVPRRLFQSSRSFKRQIGLIACYSLKQTQARKYRRRRSKATKRVESEKVIQLLKPLSQLEALECFHTQNQAEKRMIERTDSGVVKTSFIQFISNNYLGMNYSKQLPECISLFP